MDESNNFLGYRWFSPEEIQLSPNALSRFNSSRSLPTSRAYATMDDRRAIKSLIRMGTEEAHQ
jgi:hypothetical protein